MRAVGDNLNLFAYFLAMGYSVGLGLGLVTVFTVSFLTYSVKYFFSLTVLSTCY